jgi:hypothetical protein
MNALSIGIAEAKIYLMKVLKIHLIGMNSFVYSSIKELLFDFASVITDYIRKLLS